MRSAMWGKPRLLLICDRLGWANESELRALEVFCSDDFRVTVVPNSLVTQRMVNQHDVLFAAFYLCRGAEHPRSVTQISSTSYFIRRDKRLDGFPGRLLQWSWVVVKNRDLAARMRPEDHPRQRTLYHPLNYRRFNADGRRNLLQQRSHLRIGIVGHDNAQKGAAIVRDAVSGDPRFKLQHLTFDGPRLTPPQMADWYRGLDVYVCASKPGHDCGPMPPMEAGLCGCALVTTRVGQIGEMVEDGHNALVVDRTSAAIHDALVSLYNSARLRHQLGSNAAREFRQRWAIDEGRRWVQLFTDVVNA